MSDLVVKRWARYGHERLYVQTPDGTRLGHADTRTGAVVVTDEALRSVVEAAVEAHLRGQGTARETEPAVPAQRVAEEESGPKTGEASDVEQTWTDLSSTRAGAGAREQAVALHRAAPVRTLVSRVLRVKTDERAWRIGADAEEAVAARLAKLGPRWRVLHAVPVGENGSDIDHVVIGPGGVFTINTKHHPDAAVWVGGNTFLVNGHRQPYVRNSRHEARRTAKLLAAAFGQLPVDVTALIAVMGAHNGFTVKSQPPGGDVHVVTRRKVAKWLSGQPTRLDDDQVASIHAVARRSDTWRP